MWKREAGGGGGADGADPGYRIKNKNPTQSCGEKSQPRFTFGRSDVEKVYVVVARSAFRSENV